MAPEWIQRCRQIFNDSGLPMRSVNEPLLRHSNEGSSWSELLELMGFMFKVIYQVLVFLSCCYLFLKIFVHMGAKEQTLFLYEVFLYYNPFVLGILMILLWGLNLRLFNFFNMNCAHLLDLDQNQLTYTEIWKCGYWMSLGVLSSMIVYYFFHSPGEVSWVESQPVILCVITVIVLILPGNIFYGSTRRCFLRRLGSVMLPQEMIFADVLLVDVMTSMAKIFADLACAIFQYADGQVAEVAWIEADSVCGGHTIVIPVILLLPFVSRLIICFRQLYERNDRMQILNALKFSIIIAAAIFSAIKYDSISIVLNVINTLFSFTWDITQDWSISRRLRSQFRPRSTKLKWVFYIWVIGSNLILRSTWLFKLSAYSHHTGMICIFTVLELLRRTQWIYFKIEAKMSMDPIPPPLPSSDSLPPPFPTLDSLSPPLPSSHPLPPPLPRSHPLPPPLPTSHPLPPPLPTSDSLPPPLPSTDPLHFPSLIRSSSFPCFVIFLHPLLCPILFHPLHHQINLHTLHPKPLHIRSYSTTLHRLIHLHQILLQQILFTFLALSDPLPSLAS